MEVLIIKNLLYRAYVLSVQCDLKHREVDQAEIESFCKDQDFIGWTEVSVKEGLMIEETMK